MTKRYAAIEANGGYVWGVTDAPDGDLVGAAEKIDRDAGCWFPEKRYTEGTESDRRAGATGFIVYEVPAGFWVEDGASPAEIDAVDNCPRAGFVIITGVVS